MCLKLLQHAIWLINKTANKRNGVGPRVEDLNTDIELAINLAQMAQGQGQGQGQAF